MYELNKSKSLKIIRIISKVLNIQLVDDFDMVIYDLESKYNALDNININYANLLMAIILIEDREFYKHSGVVVRSIFRALISNISFFRNYFRLLPSGGSTIHMQLSRSIFIKSSQLKFKRKIVEIVLAIWMNRIFNKQKILLFYITSVRYEKNIFGLENALKYFFSDHIENMNIKIEEAFFLTERLSNITSTINWNRVNLLFSRIVNDVIIDKIQLYEIYQLQIFNNKLISKQ